LTREIEAAREEFQSLNWARWDIAAAPEDFAIANYVILAPETASRIVDLALTVERLHRFRAYLFAQSLALAFDAGGAGALQ